MAVGYRFGCRPPGKEQHYQPPTIEEIYGYLSTAVRLIAGEGKVFHFFHSSV
eukprot:m.226211 g.226211  ORF g.226211 m.226211 type:complete len:52 (+) comp15964_c0_seq16:137-292(+)